MHKFWSTLAVQLGKRAGLVSLIGLIITLILGYGVTRLEFATGQDSYLNKGDQVAKDNVAYQRLFGGQIMIALFTMDEGHTVEDLATGQNRATLLRVTEELHRTKGVETVVSPLDGLAFSHNLVTRKYDTPSSPTRAATPLESIAGKTLADTAAREKKGSPEARARARDQNLTACRLLGIPNPVAAPDAPPGPCKEKGFVKKGQLSLDPAQTRLTEPRWVNFLLHNNDGTIRRSLQSTFPDERHAQMIVRLKGNASIEDEGAAAVAVKKLFAKQKIDGAKMTVTGSPMLLKDLNDYLKGGLLTLGGIALAIMCVILLLAFDVRWRLLPILVILVGITWAFGLAGYLGIPLSVVTIAGLPVMLGVGIDYAIQMQARVEEEVVIDRDPHPIQETARNLGPALLVVTLDAAFAFCALLFAKVPMIRYFGIMLAVGIAAICLCSIFLPLAILGAREWRSPTKGHDFREGLHGRLVVWLGSLPAKVAPIFIVASSLIFIGGLLVEGKLTLQTDPVQWVNQGSQNRKDIATLEREVDSSSELGTYLVADSRKQLFSDANARFVHRFTERTLRNYPRELLRASSVLTPVSYLTEIKGASDLPPTGAEMRKSYEAAPPEVKKFLVSADRPAMNILFTTRPTSLEDKASMVDDLRNRTKPPEGVRATPSGLAVVGVGLLQNLEANRVILTYIAIGFVGIYLTIRLRSLIRALLSLVPVLIATGAASLVAFALSLKLSPMTAVGGPLVVALCTEFTSLILLRFIEERRRGMAPQAAVDATASRTGRAFMVSAFTAIVGVAVIATSPMPVLRDFGIVVAMNVVVALLSALVILPPLLVWAERWRLVTRGIVPADVLDRATKTKDEAEHLSYN